MEYDIEKILYTFEDDYNPDPRPMAQEPRNMYAGGQLVQPNADGSRPGYSGDYNVEELNKATEYYTKGEFKKFSDIKGFGQSKDPEFIKKYKNMRSLIKKQLDYHDGKFVIPDKTRVKKTDQTIELEKFLKGKKTIKQSEFIKKLTELGYKNPKLTVNNIAFNKKLNIIRDVERAPQPERKSKIYSEAQLNKASKGMFNEKTYNQLSNDEKSKVRSKLFQQGGKYSKFRKINNPLSTQEIKDIKTKYGNVYKDWDFDNYRFGIKDAKGENSKLYDKVKNFVAEPKPYELTADLKSADGWMGHQMNRAFKLEDDRYKPVKIIRNGKEKIAGFIDNTEFGGGKKYIFSEEFIKGSNADGVLMSTHPDYANTKKFVDIADKAKIPVGGALKNILKSKGVDTTRISLSDLYKYMMDEVGIEGTKNAIEKHHIKGVGVRATGDYQLLNRDLNILARDISAEIADGNLSRVNDLKKKGIRVNVGGVDFGATSNKPSSDFLKIKDEVTNFYKNNPNSSDVIKKLINQIGPCGAGKKKAVNLKTAGDVCMTGGRQTIAEFLKNGFKNANGEQKEIFKKILSLGGGAIKGVGSMLDPRELFKIKNLVGPAAWAAMGAFETGAITYDVVNNNIPLNEALGSNWITKFAMPYTLKEAQIKNLEDSGASLSPAAKEYMAQTKLMANFEREFKSLQGMKMGVFGTETPKELIQDQEKKLENIVKDVVKLQASPVAGDAGKLDFDKVFGEMAEKRGAGKYDPENEDANEYGYVDVGDSIFGFKKGTPLTYKYGKDRGKDQGRNLSETEREAEKLFPFETGTLRADYTPFNYKSFNYTPQELPADMVKQYEKDYNLPPRTSLNQFNFKGSDNNVLQDLTNEYNLSQKAKQASRYPGYHGTQSPYSEGGIASLNVKK